MQAAADALSRQGHCITMLASGVWLPGMRTRTSMASRTAYSTWTPQKPTLFDGHYLRNRSTLDIGVLGYIGIVQYKEHSPEVLSIPPGTPCICLYLHNFYIMRMFPNPLRCTRSDAVLKPTATFIAMRLAQNAKDGRRTISGYCCHHHSESLLCFEHLCTNCLVFPPVKRTQVC